MIPTITIDLYGCQNTQAIISKLHDGLEYRENFGFEWDIIDNCILDLEDQFFLKPFVRHTLPIKIEFINCDTFCRQEPGKFQELQGMFEKAKKIFSTRNKELDFEFKI